MMPTRWFIPLLIACSVCALVHRARAGQGPNTADRQGAADASAAVPRVLWIGIVSRDVDEERAQAVSALLGKALSASEGLAPFPADSFVRQGQGRPAAVDEGLKRAARFTAAGKEKLLNLALDEAIEDLQNARVAYRRHLAWLEDPGPLIDALMSLAEALAAAGQRAAAEQSYREVLAFIPDYEPDPGQVPSRLRSLFEDVREATARDLDCRLAVVAQPAGARVILDGLTVGPAPVDRGGFAPGLHVLRIEHEGHQTFRQTIEMNAGETTRVEQALERSDRRERLAQLVDRLKRGQGKDALLSASRGLGSEAKAAAVLLGQLLRVPGLDGPVLCLGLVPVQSGRPAVVAAELTAGQELQTVGALVFQISAALEEGRSPAPPPPTLRLDFSDSLLGEARPLVAPLVVPLPDKGGKGGDETYPGPPGAPPPVPPAVPPPAATPVWGRWWFWTGIGAVVLGGVATSLALTLGPETKTIYDPDQVRVRIER